MRDEVEGKSQKPGVWLKALCSSHGCESMQTSTISFNTLERKRVVKGRLLLPTSDFLLFIEVSRSLDDREGELVPERSSTSNQNFFSTDSCIAVYSSHVSTNQNPAMEIMIQAGQTSVFFASRTKKHLLFLSPRT